MTDTKKIQQEIETLLNQKLRGENILAKKEWKVTKEHTDGYDSKLLYAPVIDIGVGPFLVNRVSYSENEKMERAFSDNKRLIEQIKSEGETLGDFEYNQNPRCLIAIEVETSGSRKHLIGDIANASIFGKIGLIVPTNDANYKAFKKIIEFLKFAQENKKMHERVFNNIILIKSKKLIELLK